MGRSVALLAAALLLAGSLALLLRPRAEDTRPDIVLVVWDTCRADRTGAAGYPRPTTPALDALAAEGVNFRYAFTPSPWTPPAHASLFTGLLPSRHGLRERVGDRVHGNLELLAGTLRKAGYETVAASANPYLVTVDLLAGFERIVLGSDERTACTGRTLAGRIETVLAKREGRRKPLFLFVNLMDCHLPLAPAAEDLAAVHPEATGTVAATPGVDAAMRHMLGIERVGPEGLRSLNVAYDGGVHAADAATGRILEALRRAGRWDRTLVAITSDHGECLGDHGDLDHHLSVLDAVLRVPLVVRWPGRFEGGRVVDAQVRLQDLYPTILEAAGAAPPPGCGRDGTSLLRTPIEARDAVAEHGSFSDSVPGVKKKFPEATPEGLDRYLRSFLVLREAALGPSPRKVVVTAHPGTDGKPRGERMDMFDLRSDPGEDRTLLGPEGKPEDRAAAEALRERLTPR